MAELTSFHCILLYFSAIQMNQEPSYCMPLYSFNQTRRQRISPVPRKIPEPRGGTTHHYSLTTTFIVPTAPPHLGRVHAATSPKASNHIEPHPTTASATRKTVKGDHVATIYRPPETGFREGGRGLSLSRSLGG
jgi:hypothetical protein